MNFKKNLPLLVALAIPLFLTLFIVFSVYFPGSGPQPQTDFVYVIRNYAYGPEAFYYDVRDGQVRMVPFSSGAAPEAFEKSPSGGIPPQLYYYDVESQSSRVLTLDEAKEYRLDIRATSPDGYRLEWGSQSVGLFPVFGNGSQSTQYLIGNNRRIKTTIADYDFQFLGWVSTSN